MLRRLKLDTAGHTNVREEEGEGEGCLTDSLFLLCALLGAPLVSLCLHSAFQPASWPVHALSLAGWQV
jgi:hypothetical protein